MTGGGQPLNDGTFQITSVATIHDLFTIGSDASSTIAEFFNIFDSTAPDISIDLPAGKFQYTFYLQGVVFDQSYIGGLIQVTGVANPANNGLYTIQSLDTTDSGHHTVFCVPTNGKTNQVNESFNYEADVPVITILLRNGIQLGDL